MTIMTACRHCLGKVYREPLILLPRALPRDLVLATGEVCPASMAFLACMKMSLEHAGTFSMFSQESAQEVPNLAHTPRTMV